MQAFEDYPDEFTIVAVFDSPRDHLRANAGRHQPPFPVLADEQNQYYQEYGIEHSVWGVVKGLTTRLPSLVKAVGMGFIPLRARGRVTTMPAEFLIDADGIIRETWYGKDEGDHIPLANVSAFARRMCSDS